MRSSGAALTAASVLVISLAALTASRAQPFLVCDPYPRGHEQPTAFVVTEDKVTYSAPAERLVDGSVRMRFDLSQLPDGEHALGIKAVNGTKRTESGSVPFKLIKNGAAARVIETQRKPEKEKILPSRTIPGRLGP
jgi:hypothetical protein